MNRSSFTKDTVHKMAKLCNLDLTESEIDLLYGKFLETFHFIDVLDELDISETHETHQVTGLKNVVFDDETALSFELTTELTLSNAHNTSNSMFELSQVLKKGVTDA